MDLRKSGYSHSDTTIYRTPRLRIGGLYVDGVIDGERLVESNDDDGSVWTVAAECVLSLHSERPNPTSDDKMGHHVHY